jgi:nucleoside-diphosphate-sugar epimerase
MKILVTGASGFVGRELVGRLLQPGSGYEVLATMRSAAGCDLPAAAHVQTIPAIDGATDWFDLCAGCDCVVHLAARVHVMQDAVADPLAEYRRVNVEGTLNLARQAAAAGVRRFIFISSIKVNGEFTPAGLPFTAVDAPAPSDPYGQSKLEAELGLRQLSILTGMEFVIIRPPLVYGPKVRANFGALRGVVARGIPLPLGAVQNLRSFVSLANLVDLISVCLIHPNAKNQLFLVSDGDDVSTPELVRRMAHALGRPVRLLSVPSRLLTIGAMLLRQEDSMRRLSEFLQVDIEYTRNQLQWKPPLTLDQGLLLLVQGEND